MVGAIFRRVRKKNPVASEEFRIRDFGVICRGNAAKDVNVVRHDAMRENFDAAKVGNLSHEGRENSFFSVAKQKFTSDNTSHAVVIVLMFI